MPRFIRLSLKCATVAVAALILWATPAFACKDGIATAVTSLVNHPDQASALLPMINRERTAVGLAPLRQDPGATAIADGFAHQLAAAGNLWHNDSYFTSLVRHTLHATVLGENVACNWSLDAAHIALMASPGHRANIMDSRFTAVGLAVVSRPDGAIYIAEDFLAGSGAAAPAVTAPVGVAPSTTAKPAAAPAPAPAPTAPKAPPVTAPAVKTASIAPATVQVTTAAAPAPSTTVIVATPTTTPVVLPMVSLNSTPAATRGTDWTTVIGAGSFAVGMVLAAFGLRSLVRSRLETS